MDILEYHGRNFQYLKNALLGDKLQGAYLFYGPKGSGKFNFALEFSKYLQCKERGGKKYCGSCKNCLLSKDGRVISSAVINKSDKENISIDEIREIKKGIELSSYEGNKKIFIINNFQNINYQAKDLLLKTLEEPPKGTVFILITSNKASVSNTILSRCSLVFFPKKDLDGWKNHLISNGVELDNPELTYLSTMGDLGFGTSFGELDNGGYREDIFQEIESLFVQEDDFEKLIIAKKIIEEESFQKRIEEWTSVFYHLFLMSNGQKAFSGNVNTQLKNLEKKLSYDKILDILEKLSEVFSSLDKNNSKRILLENLVLNI